MEDFTPSQRRSIELTHRLLPIIQGEEANAVAGALTFLLGATIGKFAKTEAQAIKMAGQFSGDISRTALDFLAGPHDDA